MDDLNYAPIVDKQTRALMKLTLQMSAQTRRMFHGNVNGIRWMIPRTEYDSIRRTDRVAAYATNARARIIARK